MAAKPKKKETKNIMWYTLALMAFSSVWGFGNVVNGFSEYGGLQAITSWLLIFGLYFVPYSLMVGEMGSAFKEEGGGVSSWINETTTAKLAYYAGWTYWIVHMPTFHSVRRVLLLRSAGLSMATRASVRLTWYGYN